MLLQGAQNRHSNSVVIPAATRFAHMLPSEPRSNFGIDQFWNNGALLFECVMLAEPLVPG